MVGIISYGAYIPRKRLQRQAVVEANSWFNPALKAYGKGERAMCNWDEDSVTMAVEAARDCLGGEAPGELAGVYLATTSAPFKDRQNAGILATALNLGDELMTMDLTGSQRAGT
ncbi:MAG: hydroxymethylglutaryl-CoA synthase family protein, partial [Alphaproteobacteria bacterium]|nr:hydroxymethylglutaryl-CoA synthase family protein [Alphaproteobacteria bacterium]